LRLIVEGKKFRFDPKPGAVYRVWSDDTVCRKNPLQTVTRRLEIIEAAEADLQRLCDMSDERHDAVAFARLECARSLYQLDRPAALRIAAAAMRAHPKYKLPRADCFPDAYRRVYRVAGFQVAERAAELIRPLRKNVAALVAR
jgi:hypothetical protein